MFMLTTAVRLWDEGAGESAVGSGTLRGFLASLLYTMRREWRVRRDAAYLGSFDDRMLHDIGINRGELEHHVRAGRGAVRFRPRRNLDVFRAR
jgi:uncharacterized protein YjiS (DUF1127 family)